MSADPAVGLLQLTDLLWSGVSADPAVGLADESVDAARIEVAAVGEEDGELAAAENPLHAQTRHRLHHLSHIVRSHRHGTETSHAHAVTISVNQL